MAMFTDATSGAVDRALDAVALRQRVAAQNIANVMTPGYRAQKVEFESALSDALERGAPREAAISTVAAGGPQREDGNDVVMENETTTLMQSGLQYQALVEAASFKINVLRAAIGR